MYTKSDYLCLTSHPWTFRLFFELKDAALAFSNLILAQDVQVELRQMSFFCRICAYRWTS